MLESTVLCLLIFAAAALYSSVGHGGASGYLAVMALMNVAPETMKPAALVLNLLVATIGTIHFYRAGHFSWRLLLPLVVGSIPFAFLGGYLSLPGTLYKQLLGVVLLLAGARLLASFWKPAAEEPVEKPVHPAVALICGAGIGLLAGLTGTGGGIFLTPLLLFTHWAQTKRAAAVSSAFILVNSLAGLLGHLAKFPQLPSFVAYWAIAAVLGGMVGSQLGSKRLGHPALQGLLGVVLLVAAAKLMLVR